MVGYRFIVDKVCSYFVDFIFVGCSVESWLKSLNLFVEFDDNFCKLRKIVIELSMNIL